LKLEYPLPNGPEKVTRGFIEPRHVNNIANEEVFEKDVSKNDA